MTIPHYLRRATAGLFITGLIFALLPPVLRVLDPTAGSFGIEILNALGLAAMLFSGVLHGGLFVYEKFLPGFYKYQGESLEKDAKLYENLSQELKEPLYQDERIYADRLAVYRERRKVNQFIFQMRCTRLNYSLFSIAFLLCLGAFMVNLAMTAVPASAPASLPKPTSSSASASAAKTAAPKSKPSSKKPAAASATPGAPGPSSWSCAAPDSSSRVSAKPNPGLMPLIPSGATACSWQADPRLSRVTSWASLGAMPKSATSKCSSSGAPAPAAAR
ncbi:MAG TPA: hypothetical protein VF630_13360 [Hymenobacter sp.]